MQEQRRLVAYLDGFPLTEPRQAQGTQLRAHQAETQKELSSLMPGILERRSRERCDGYFILSKSGYDDTVVAIVSKLVYQNRSKNKKA
jgi:hypothetical protein